jgi:hypothetical protein
LLGIIELAKIMQDAGLENGSNDDNDDNDSVSTLHSIEEDGIMTDFEALADVDVPDGGHAEVMMDNDVK